MNKYIPLTAMLLTTALTSVLGISSAYAQTAATTASPADIDALHNAKSVRVTETAYRRQRNAAGQPELGPDEKLDITFARPGSYRISAQDLSAGQASSKPDIFVSNGAVVTEYVAASNQFLTRTLATDADYQKYKAMGPGAEMFGLSTVLKLGIRGGLSLIAGSFAEMFTPRNGATLATTSTTLDGTPASLITMTVPPSKDPRMITTSARLYLDAKTGLPRRYESYYFHDEKEVVISRFDYTDWAIDTPVTSSTFAWNVPAGATPYPSGGLLAVGTPAPDFTATTSEGKIVHLSDFKGKAVIIDFWATWCVPCQQALPHLQSVYEQTKGQPVTVLALCVWDKKDAYNKWVREKKGTYSFPTAFDAAGDAASNIAQGRYGVHAIPTQYLIDKDGNVAYAKTGGEGRDLEEALAKLNIMTKPIQTSSATVSH